MLIKYHIKNFVKNFPEYKNPPLMQALGDENYMLVTYNIVNQLLDNGIFFHVLNDEMIIVEID